MAEQRLTNQDLADILVKKHGLEKEDAENFIKEFFLLIEEALQKDGIAKVKGFGTFKLTEVKSRESINVNTGERFEIQGHTKVSFTPDPLLRDFINKPFAHFETIVLNDGVTFDDIQDDETDLDDTEDNVVDNTPETSIEDSREEIIETTSIDTPIEISVNEEKELPPPVPVVSETIYEPEETSPIIEAEKPEKEETAENEAVEEEVKEESETEETVVLTEENIEPITKQEEAEKEITYKSTRLPLEEIIARELQDTNRFFNKSVDGEILDSSGKELKTNSSPSSKKFMVITIILAILICSSAVLFTYFPNFMDDLFGYKQPKNVVTEISEGIEVPAISPIATDTIKTAAPVNEKLDSARLDVETIPIEPKKEIPPVVPATKTITPEKKQPVTRQESKPAEKKVEKTQPKAEPQTSKIVSDNSPVKPDSTNYNIVGTKTTHTIESGETLTRVSLRFYGTKDLWPYLVMHNKSKIPNPAVVPAGLTINIPELKKK